MPEFDELHLSPYYLNSRRLTLLSNVDLPIAAQVSIAQNSGARTEAMYDVAKLAECLLRSGRIPNLTAVFPNVGGEGERILGFVWGVFNFKDASSAIQREQKGMAYENATFSGTLPLGGENFSVRGKLYNEHFFSVSSSGMLSGRRRMLMAGQFQFDKTKIEAFPYLIGEVTRDVGLGFQMPWSSSVRVYPSCIDAFKCIEGKRATQAEIKRVREISEDDVKHAFAEILGEPFVPKDWGGELSDLYTSRITVQGKPLSAAFIFKGPSVQGEMHIRNMGKRGDQLIRAFDEAADLIVVQHCNQIANNVVRMTEALAYDIRRPRRYCIIDGHDTALILRAYEELKTR